MAGNVAMTGLVSGMDTDSIVSALVSAYSVKKDKYVKSKTKLEWKQDAWKDLNTKIYGFYSGKLSTMRFSNAFSVKKATTTSSKATVKAASDAVTGTQSLQINKLATTGYLTGGKLDSSTKIKGSTKLSELGIEDGSSISVTVNGKEKNFTVNSTNSVNEFVNQLKSAGVNASFDENNQRFFISSKESGASSDFSITANNDAGAKLLSTTKLNTVSSAEIENYRKKASMTDEDIQKLIDTAYTKGKKKLYDITDTTAMDKIKSNLSSTKDKAVTANEKLAKANEDIDTKLSAVNDVKDLSKEEKDELLKSANERIDELSKKKDITDDEKKELEELKIKATVYKEATKTSFDADKLTEDLNKSRSTNEETITSNEETIATIESALADDEGFEAYIDSENAKITESNDELLDKTTNLYNSQRESAKAFVDAYDLINSEGVDKSSQAYKDAIALVGSDSGDGLGAVRISGQDAEITLNGAKYTSTSNNFSVNGLTITANEVTKEGETISVTTENDVQGIYDMVKDFFKSYNELIKEMDTLYGAESSKGYEPLTDDEKEELSDDEVEKWEKKIKDSLLRRDQTLGNVADAMKSAFMKSYNVNGVNMSLASFGIKTAGYAASAEHEQYTYHIDGDSDDTRSSGNKDKLMAAIASDPESVTSFFNQLTKGVYDELSRKMASSSMSSAYTVYNDKQMTTQQKEYKSLISSWEDKVSKYEEKYRKQFTAMETALSKLNSTSNSVFGTSAF